MREGMLLLDIQAINVCSRTIEPAESGTEDQEQGNEDEGEEQSRDESRDKARERVAPSTTVAPWVGFGLGESE